MLNAKNEDKQFVIVIVRDTSGCSHVRLRWNALYYGGFEHIGFVPIITPIPTYDPAWLSKCRAVVYQRPINQNDLEILKTYKNFQPKYGYKLIFECDDQVFKINDEGLPYYNMASDNFNKQADELTERVKIAVNMCDEVVVSTDYLAKQFKEKYNCQNVRVIRNVVPRFLWSYPRKDDITEDIKKPKILYTGSPCHFRNPIAPRQPSKKEPEGFKGVLADMGDFNNAWKDWLIKNVKEDKIDLIVMGSMPYFFAPIADKIKNEPWYDTTSYPRHVMEQMADFQIAPLVENEFNKCKSSLRFVESSATGTILLGTVFHTCKDSPYEEIHQDCKIPDNITTKELDEKFWALCKKDKYNEIRNWQYDTINKNGYWMESTKHANEWMSMIDGTPDEKFI